MDAISANAHFSGSYPNDMKAAWAFVSNQLYGTPKRTERTVAFCILMLVAAGFAKELSEGVFAACAM